VNTIEDNFNVFHNRNPHVYKNLVDMAKEYRLQRRSCRVGIATLWEALRWSYLITTTDDDFKLNNSYRALYARIIMANEPELRGLFETRRRISLAEPE
jgi:hypothetical protein